MLFCCGFCVEGCGGVFGGSLGELCGWLRGVGVDCLGVELCGGDGCGGDVVCWCESGGVGDVVGLLGEYLGCLGCWVRCGSVWGVGEGVEVVGVLWVRVVSCGVSVG